MQCTFGVLLTAICGLLVPVIAQKCLKVYDGYLENAKLYTQRFATADRPAADKLLFPEEAKNEAILNTV